MYVRCRNTCKSEGTGLTMISGDARGMLAFVNLLYHIDARFELFGPTL